MRTTRTARHTKIVTRHAKIVTRHAKIVTRHAKIIRLDSTTSILLTLEAGLTLPFLPPSLF
jgi:hypothetical protein